VNVKETLDALVKLRGAQLHWIDEPIAPEDPGVVAQHYIDHLPENCKVLVLMHMVNWTGQILPIREIAVAARERGIFVIADGAHACAQFPVDLHALGVDAWAASLMKWLNAPFGTGVMYLRREQIERLVPIFPQKNIPDSDIRKFEGQGTRAYAAELAILHAIEYHRALGQARKTARLRYLTRYWTQQAANIPGFKLHTTLKGEWYGALALFTLDGWTPEDLVQALEERYHIHVVPIDWRGIRGVRVTPTFYSTLAELDALVAALRELGKGN
ncbi:MAG: aminotransferase class V-fold PLP-dependent enzyme, partial [Bacteroidota bacterium]